MVEMLREHPTWLALLLRALGHGERSPPTVVADPTLRLTDPDAVTLDLLFGDGVTGPWTLLEVQLKIDADKATVWPLAVSWLRHRRGVSGDLVVITASESVSRWASTVGASVGALGTSLTLRPVVVHLGLDEAHALLATRRDAGLREGHDAGVREGLREGRITALLAVLAAKGIAVDAASRARIERCDDADRLDAWIRRAAVASALGDVLDDAH